MQPDFSVVVPVYRSVETLEPLFDGVAICMKELNYSFEVIFVEDSGSKDSWKELLKLKKLHSDQLTIIRLSKNFGQNGATLCGITAAKGKQLISIDDDLQIHPKEIAKLIDRQKETDAAVVYGTTPKQKTAWVRRFGSKFIKKIFNKHQGENAIGSSFRLIDGHVAERLRDHSQDHLFINQVITWYTADIETVEVDHQPRSEGKSGYSFIKLVLLSFRLILYYTSIPLKLMVFLAFLVAFGLIGLLVYYVYFKVNEGEGLDLFMIAVLAAMAVTSASIGVFGVYINRIYSSRVRRPNYAIKIKL